MYSHFIVFRRYKHTLNNAYDFFPNRNAFKCNSSKSILIRLDRF